ncbi:MAG: hypothetical protein WAK69_15730 [Rhodoplanes sp.]
MTRRVSAKERAYLTGFVLGYCLGKREASKELRQIGDEFEAKGDQLRAEVSKTIAEIRQQWGLGPPDPDRLKITVQ